MATDNKKCTNLEFRRRELGLSRADLSRKTGIANGTIERWENRRSNLSGANISFLVSLSNALETSIENLIEDSIDVVTVSDYRALDDNLTNLERLRISLRLSRNDLEKMTGISARTIEQYEQRRASINGASARIVLALAKALEVDVTDILE